MKVHALGVILEGFVQTVAICLALIAHVMKCSWDAFRMCFAGLGICLARIVFRVHRYQLRTFLYVCYI